MRRNFEATKQRSIDVNVSRYNVYSYDVGCLDTFLRYRKIALRSRKRSLSQLYKYYNMGCFGRLGRTVNKWVDRHIRRKRNLVEPVVIVDAPAGEVPEAGQKSDAREDRKASKANRKTRRNAAENKGQPSTSILAPAKVGFLSYNNLVFFVLFLSFNLLNFCTLIL